MRTTGGILPLICWCYDPVNILPRVRQQFLPLSPAKLQKRLPFWYVLQLSEHKYSNIIYSQYVYPEALVLRKV